MRPHLTPAALLGLLAGCAPEGPLLDPLAWESVGEDPWGDGPECTWWGFEDAAVELSTDACAWPSIAQPTQHALEAGERLEGAVIWETLYAEAPAEAVMGVALGGDVLWEDRVPIPSGEGERRYVVELDRDVPAGTSVVLHVHNHGMNTYTFLPPRRME